MIQNSRTSIVVATVHCVWLVSVCLQAFCLAQDAPVPPRYLAPRQSESATTLETLITQYNADIQTIRRRFRLALDPLADELKDAWYDQWQELMAAIPYESLDLDSKIDWHALVREIEHDRLEQARLYAKQTIAAELIPYMDNVNRIGAAREHGQPVTAESIANLLDTIAAQATEAAKAPDRIEGLDKARDASGAIDPNIATVASDLVDQLLRSLQDSHRYYEGYDPAYNWWASKPYESAKSAITNHRKAIREKLAQLNDSDNEKIVGVPIGEEALREALKHAWIAYSPEQLIRIGEHEMEWCDAEFRKAADELGLEGDWHRALDLVKTLHVEPGDQPRLIRELAWEAIRFLEAHELVTVPEMAKHGWRIDMMSPEAQRVNPYFLGGENIIVSFPTNTMAHSEKLMSLKSNNIHFCRATVHHELIPGHHLQHYMLARYRPYRESFRTPFWTEGWALYWEMLLWDLGFAQSPEDRVGMLFWRRHRAARIFFSLNYQTGRWTAEQCVQYLIDRVGHEPSAAAAEVRRSIMGGYGPLYQAAYLLGGLQIRRLHQEIVQTGRMTNRQFHDAILQENQLPIELLRYKLLGEHPTKDATPHWMFYSETLD